MEGERPNCQEELSFGWTTGWLSLGTAYCEITVLPSLDYENILLMYQNKIQGKF